MQDPTLDSCLQNGFDHVGRMPLLDDYVKNDVPWEKIISEEDLVCKRRANNDLVLSKLKATELDEEIYKMKAEEADKGWMTEPRPWRPAIWISSTSPGQLLCCNGGTTCRDSEYKWWTAALGRRSTMLLV